MTIGFQFFSSPLKKVGLFGLFGILVAFGLFLVPKAEALANAPTVYIQAGDGRGNPPPEDSKCSNQLGAMGIDTFDDDDMDCVRVQLVNSSDEVYNEDFRLCFYVQTPASCTPWASEGGGSGPVVTGGNSLTYLGMQVQKRSLPAELASTTFRNVGVGVQLYYRSDGSSCGGSSGTAFSYGNGTVSPWAYGASGDDDPGCGRVILNVSVYSPYSAEYVSSTLAGATMSAGSAQSGYNVVMRNTGHFWTSDQVISQTGNCDDYTPGPDAGTCELNKIYTSSTIQLRLVNGGGVNFGTDTFPYQRATRVIYSSQNITWTETPPCEEHPGGGDGDIPPLDAPINDAGTISNWFAQVWNKLFPKAYATHTCAPPIQYSEWVTVVNESPSPHVLTPDTATFSLPNFTAPAAGVYTLQFRMVKLNGAADGTYSDGTFEQTGDVTFTVVALPDFALNCASITPSISQSVTQGGSATWTVPCTTTNLSSAIEFSITAPANATAIGSSTAAPPLSSGSQPVTVTTTASTPTAPNPHVLAITATSGSITRTCNVNLTVNAPLPTADIKASNQSGSGFTDASVSVAYNSPAYLNWTSINTTDCTVTSSPDVGTWSGTQNPNQGTPALTSGPVVFTANCNGPGGSGADSVTVYVGTPPVPTCDIKANGSDGPITIGYGSAAILSWTTTAASSAQVNPGGFTGTSGSNVSTGNLTSNTTYTLTASGPGGNCPPDSVTINVSAAPDFALNCSSITPSISQSVTQGGSATWTVPYTTSGGLSTAINFTISTPPNATATGSSTAAPPPSSGSQPVTITTTASTPTTPNPHVLTVTATSGSITRGCDVNLTVNQDPPNPPTITSANNSTCGQVTVNWSLGTGVTPTGFRVYNSTVSGVPVWNVISGTDPLPAGARSFTHNTNTSSNNRYMVRAFNGQVASEDSNIVLSNANSCALTNDDSAKADKDVKAVSGRINKVFNPIPCSGISEIASLPNNALFSPGDIVTFQINVCNTGNAAMTGVRISDQLIRLTEPSTPTSPQGCVDTNSYQYDANTGVMNFNLSNIAAPPSGGTTVCSIVFTAKVTAPANGSAALYRFQNKATIYTNELPPKDVLTPPYVFSITGGVPGRTETAPQ